MRTSSLIFVALVAGIAARTAAAADSAVSRKVAMMPLGSAVLLPSVRESLDGDMRAAVALLEGVALQPSDETQAHITEAGNNGMDLAACPATRDDCAVRIGVVADVDFVVTINVEEVGDRLLLHGSWLATDGSVTRHIAGELVAPQKDNGSSLRAFIARLVTGEGRAQNLPFSLSVEPKESAVRVDGAPMALPPDHLLWLLPGVHTLHIDAPERAPVERVITVNSDGDGNALTLALSESDTPYAFYVGLVGAGVGGLLALGAGSIVAGVELQLETGQIPNVERESTINAAKAALWIGGGGAVLLGSGAALAAWGYQ